MKRFFLTVAPWFLGMVGHCTGQVEPTAAELLEASGVAAGLAVHLGSSDGKLEVELTNDGRMLVHGLAVDDAHRDAARRTIFSSGLSGLATVATWHDRGRLPYATNLANLLVADLDLLGAAAPGRDELERVVAPEGVMLIRQNGKWTRNMKPRPAEMDDWGHFDHDARGLGTSADRLVDPVRQQQWVTSLQPIPEDGNPAAYDPGGGIRIDGRFALMDVNDSRGAPEKAKKSNFWALHCRDAFNGTPLWTIPRPREASRSRWSLVAEDGLAYTWLVREGNLTAINLASGNTVRTYDGTAAPEAMTDGESLCVRVDGDNLLVGLRERLLCFDAAGGKQRWAFERKGCQLLAPVLDVLPGRIYCVVARSAKKSVFRGRWPAIPTVESVIALELGTGKPVWECAEVASKETGAGSKGPMIRGIGQLLPGDAHLMVFGSKAIGGGSSQFIGSIRLADGKLVHGTDEPFVSNYNMVAYNAVLRGGMAYFAGAFTNVWRYDPATGEIELVVGSSWNQRCTRFSATPRWLMFGQAAYYSEDFAGVQVSVGRAGCALPNTPANGMTYFTPTMCGCTTLVRGFQAMTGERFTSPVAESARLVKGGAPPALMTGNELPPGPVAKDWLKQDRAGRQEIGPVAAGDLELHVIPHQHRIEARRDGQPVWSFVANARISSLPVLAGGLVVFGSHDGWVYGVGADGTLRWKYLLAPAERLIGINGQLENTWPVYGVALLGDRVLASAGTHVELDGGVTVAAIDPSSGRPDWIKHLSKSASEIPAGGKGAKIVAHSFLNSVPRVTEDGMIELGDGGRRGGTFQFAPDDEEPALNVRLNTPVKKK